MQARYGEEEEELVEIYWRERKRRFRQVERQKEGKKTGEEVCATKKNIKKFTFPKVFPSPPALYSK